MTTEKIKFTESYKAAIHRIVKKRGLVKIATVGKGKFCSVVEGRSAKRDGTVEYGRRCGGWRRM